MGSIKELVKNAIAENVSKNFGDFFDYTSTQVDVADYKVTFHGVISHKTEADFYLDGVYYWIQAEWLAADMDGDLCFKLYDVSATATYYDEQDNEKTQDFFFEEIT